MDIKVPGPIKMEEIAIKFEPLDLKEKKNYYDDSRIIEIKEEPISYSEEDDVDENVLEECDVLIKQDPENLMLKDPLSTEGEDVSQKFISNKGEPIHNYVGPNFSSMFTTCNNNFTEPFGQQCVKDIPKNIVFLVLNQQVFAVALPSDFIQQDSSGVKVIIQPYMSNGGDKSSQPQILPSEKETNCETVYLYKCLYCNEKFKEKVNLLQHMLQSHQDEQITVIDSSPYVLKCFFCPGRCKTRLDLHKHIIETHYPKKMGGIYHNLPKVQILHPLTSKKIHAMDKKISHNPPCMLDSDGKKIENMDADLEVKRDSKNDTIRGQLDVTNYIFICYYCHGRSSSKEELELHIRETHIPYLGVVAPGPSLMKSIHRASCQQGIKKQNRSVFHCIYCTYQAQRPCMIRDHVSAKHTYEKPYKCELCDHRSSSKSLMLSHLKSKHGEKQFKCDQCDYRAAQLCKVKYHFEAKHSKLKKYECPHCDYRAVHSAGLRGHIILHHEKSRLFHCPYCKYVTRHASGLRIHVLAKHSVDKPFRCDKCDYAAVTPRNLKYHIITKHSDDRPYSCEYCTYKSVVKNSLKRHIESKHMDFKQYTCEYCEYKSSRPLVLQKHVQSKHLNEKPYQCYHCGYRTVWFGNLKLHIRAKHNHDRWYRCPYCYFRTFISQNVKTHIKSKHFKNGQIEHKPKRARGRPPQNGRSYIKARAKGVGKPRGRPRKVQSNFGVVN